MLEWLRRVVGCCAGSSVLEMSTFKSGRGCSSFPGEAQPGGYSRQSAAALVPGLSFSMTGNFVAYPEQKLLS